MVGYIAQYEIAAGLLLDALTADVPLDWVAVTDPEAGRLDDFQQATLGQLDAFQIKWSESGGQLAWGQLRRYVEDLLNDRHALATAHPDRQVIAHLATDRVPSSSAIGDAPEDDGRYTGAAAVAQLLQPASQGRFHTTDDIPERWRWLWDDLARAVGVDPPALLVDFASVRLEFGSTLPTEREFPSRDAARYRQYISDIRTALLDVARDPTRPVRLTREEFIERLPAGWRFRLELAASHEFPAPIVYEPIQDTAAAVQRAINDHCTGYVALVGSPGSGKSTLLSQELRSRPDLVARYYAYVRGRGELGAQRAEASNFLHDLVLTLERAGLPRGPGPVDFDIANLTHRLRGRLRELGARYAADNRRAIIMIDGLDHVERAVPLVSMLRYLPAPADVPEGVLLFVVGSQTVRMLDEEIRTQLREPGRTMTIQGLDGPAIERLAGVADVTVDTRQLRRITGGHPLLLDYVLGELSALPAPEQPAALADMTPYGGDVLALYDRLWTGSIRDDPELVELLALVSRIRAAIDLGWLRDRGRPAPRRSCAGTSKLQSTTHPLFTARGK